MDLLAAKGLLAKQLSVIPIQPGKKSPALSWSEFQSRLATEAEIEEWFRRWPGANLGIVTGKLSGVVVVDTDSPTAEAWAQANLPETPMMTATARGRHRFYRWSGVRVPNRARIAVDGGQLGLDVRGDGGFVVAPGSLHPSGSHYRAEGTWPDVCELPSFDPSWLSIRRGRRRQAVSADVDGARAYLEEVPPAVEGAAGDDRTFDVCRHLIHQFGLTTDQSMTVLSFWNARCIPPWSETELRAKLENARNYPGDLVSGDQRGRTSVATRLVELARDAGIDIWRSPVGRGYISVPSGASGRHLECQSGGFRDWLTRLYSEATREVPNQAAVANAVAALAAEARGSTQVHEPATRIAEHQGRIYMDLADPSGCAVEVSEEGWRLVEDPPVRFLRPPGLLPLAVPERGSLEPLRGLVGAMSEEHFRAVVAFCVSCLRGQGPFPVLALHGEQGAGKSTAARLLVSLIDPREASLRGQPETEEVVMTAALNGYLLAFDNLSEVRPWLSDVLCRLSSGTSFTRRTLYTNGDEFVVNAARPLVVTSITDVLVRGDLLDRAVIVRLKPIGDGDRQTEAEMLKAFQQAKPGILGALLDAVAAGLRGQGQASATRLPRMADFVRFISAAEPALGWEPGSFARFMIGQRTERAGDSLDGDLVGQFILNKLPLNWVGTADELLRQLFEAYPGDRALPKSPRGLAAAIDRLTPSLRELSVEVTRTRTGARRIITIRRTSGDDGTAKGCRLDNSSMNSTGAAAALIDL